MMNIDLYPDIIAIGIPAMALCLLIEFFYDRKQTYKTYEASETASNVGCGIFEQVTGFVSKTLFFVLYVVLYQNYHLLELQDTFWVWIALIVVVDFIFYWFHRLSHTSAFLWSGHMIHHEVNKFNLSVALRRSVMQEFTIILPYLPLALVGFSPAAFFLVFAGHNLYQFLIHTSYGPEFRLFGLIFNTPYHHEAHHARNKCYVDTNFAGVLIIWDKMFGTFVKPTEEYKFGVGSQTTTLNPVKAQITTLRAVFRETGRSKGLKAKLTALFGSPAYLSVDRHPADAQGNVPKRFDYNPAIGAKKKRLAVVTIFTLLAFLAAYRIFELELSLTFKVGFLVVATAILYSIGIMLDGGKKTAADDTLETTVQEVN